MVQSSSGAAAAILIALAACGDPKTPDQADTHARTVATAAPKPEAPADPMACDDSRACPPGARCQNGHCVMPPNGGPGCTDFPSPKFAFESAQVFGEEKATLDRLVACLTTGGLKTARVLLVGHCDARGEMEFNMGLGDQRAQVVKDYLVSKGVAGERLRTSSRGKLDAAGNDEAGYAEDRRVDIEVR